MKIIEAAKKGNIAEFETLISQGADINEVDESGRSAIHWAAINGHSDLLKWLVEEKGQSIDTTDEEGRTPFFECCYEKQWETASICLKLGANPNCYTNGTAPVLMVAASLQVSLIEEMLAIKDGHGSQKLDLSVSLKSGQNVLHLAAASKTVSAQINLDLMESLYDLGAPNVEDARHKLPSQYLTGCHDYYFGHEFEMYVSDHPKG